MNWNWGKSITLVVAIFILFCFSIIYITAQNSNTLVAKDYYQKELNYNQQQTRINNGKQYKAEFNITYDLQNELIQVKFPKKPDISGVIHFYKPSNAKMDFKTPISLDTNQVQYISLKQSVSKGLWRIKITWDSASMPFYNEIRVDL